MTTRDRQDTCDRQGEQKQCPPKNVSSAADGGRFCGLSGQAFLDRDPHIADGLPALPRILPQAALDDASRLDRKRVRSGSVFRTAASVSDRVGPANRRRPASIS